MILAALLTEKRGHGLISRCEAFFSHCGTRREKALAVSGRAPKCPAWVGRTTEKRKGFPLLGG